MTDKEKIDALLGRALKLGERIDLLREEADRLFEERKRVESPDTEGRCWSCVKQADGLSKFQDLLLSAAELLEAGGEVKDLEWLLPELPKWKIGRNNRQHRFDEAEEGHDGRFLTTGRRGTSVKGNFNSFDAPEAFFEATADTHGGKVRGGSRSAKGTYVDNKSGRRIRKY